MLFRSPPNSSKPGEHPPQNQSPSPGPPPPSLAHGCPDPHAATRALPQTTTTTTTQTTMMKTNSRPPTNSPFQPTPSPSRASPSTRAAPTTSHDCQLSLYDFHTMLTSHLHPTCVPFDPWSPSSRTTCTARTFLRSTAADNVRKPKSDGHELIGRVRHLLPVFKMCRN